MFYLVSVPKQRETMPLFLDGFPQESKAPLLEQQNNVKTSFFLIRVEVGAHHELDCD